MRLTPLAVAMLVSGCSAQMVVQPPPASHTVEFALAATVSYDGNRNYLPRVVRDAGPGSPITVRYAYDVVHGGERTHLFGVMFNPAAMLGLPMLGKDTVAVSGRLEILGGAELVKAYDATAALTNRPSLFYEGETYTEMRLRGLLAVRDSIETQILGDRDTLTRLLGAAVIGGAR
jgi:hypothetical protein